MTISLCLQCSWKQTTLPCLDSYWIPACQPWNENSFRFMYFVPHLLLVWRKFLRKPLKIQSARLKRSDSAQYAGHTIAGCISKIPTIGHSTVAYPGTWRQPGGEKFCLVPLISRYRSARRPQIKINGNDHFDAKMLTLNLVDHFSLIPSWSENTRRINWLSLKIAFTFPCVTTEHSTYNIRTVTAILILTMLA